MGICAYTKPKNSLLSRDGLDKSAQTTHSSKSKRQQQLLLPLLNPNSIAKYIGKLGNIYCNNVFLYGSVFPHLSAFKNQYFYHVRQSRTRCDKVVPGLGTTNLLFLLLSVSEQGRTRCDKVVPGATRSYLV
jgi:hypothetical protein